MVQLQSMEGVHRQVKVWQWLATKDVIAVPRVPLVQTVSVLGAPAGLCRWASEVCQGKNSRGAATRVMHRYSHCIRLSSVPVDVQTASQYSRQAHAHLGALQGPEPDSVRRAQLPGPAEQPSAQPASLHALCQGQGKIWRGCDRGCPQSA